MSAVLLRVRFTSEILVASVLVCCLATSLASMLAHWATSSIPNPTYALRWFKIRSQSAMKSSSTRCIILTPSLSPPILSTVSPLASPAMGHWGTCPPRLPASYFKRTNTENVQKQRDCCAIVINFWPIFCHFLPAVFLRD